MAFELKKEGFKLKDILKVVDIPEATYHYHIKQSQKENSDKELKELIYDFYHEYDRNYWYRRIHSKLRAKCYIINHKRVQKIMRVMGLKCEKSIRKSRYKSYKGTVGKVAKNRLNRPVKTNIRLQMLVTDMTEFKCSNNKKLYLNSIMDLYNGEIISNKPTLDVVTDPLNKAIDIINKEEEYRTTIHSDQGWHYQHNTWVKILKKNKVFQSISRKGTCADNAVMENFFGILKQEMYYGESLVTYEKLKKELKSIFIITIMNE